MTYTNDQIKIAEIYERFEEHEKLYDEPVRHDKWIWQTVDSMTPEQFIYLLYFAQDSKFWNIELDNWVEDLKERNPFWIRQSKEKMKTSKNNNNIWKVLMLAREVIKARIKELSDPRNTLFYCETLV